jgi:hypothetical protein
MELGWENCFLKSATGTPLYKSTAIFARLTNSTLSSVGNNSSGGSKAWIAGPVVGGVIVVVLVTVAGLFVSRRRKNARREADRNSAPAAQGYQEQMDYGLQYQSPQGEYQSVASNVWSTAPAYQWPVEIGHGEINELHDTPAPRRAVFRELEA